MIVWAEDNKYKTNPGNPGTDYVIPPRTENNMFGSLQNTTTSGIPIPLNYGVMRVAGQFLSGYVLSTEHGQDNSPSVESIFVADSTPLATATPNDE